MIGGSRKEFFCLMVLVFRFRVFSYVVVKDEFWRFIKKLRFYVNKEIFVVFYLEEYGDFVKLINFLGVIGILIIMSNCLWV